HCARLVAIDGRVSGCAIQSQDDRCRKWACSIYFKNSPRRCCAPFLRKGAGPVKEWRLHGSSEAPHLSMARVAVPEPAARELLIAVHAVGVTPTELLWYPTTHRKSGGPRT